jgi:hypothetical protein
MFVVNVENRLGLSRLDCLVEIVIKVKDWKGKMREEHLLAVASLTVSHPVNTVFNLSQVVTVSIYCTVEDDARDISFV